MEVWQYVVGEGLRGIADEPGLTSTPMFVEDERIFPLYERCQALGVPVMLMVGSNCGPDIGYSKPEHAERVAKAFPRFNIILSHGGWPWVTEAIHVAYRYKNVYLLPDCTSSTAREAESTWLRRTISCGIRCSLVPPTPMSPPAGGGGLLPGGARDPRPSPLSWPATPAESWSWSVCESSLR